MNQVAFLFFIFISFYTNKDTFLRGVFNYSKAKQDVKRGAEFRRVVPQILLTAFERSARETNAPHLHPPPTSPPARLTPAHTHARPRDDNAERQRQQRHGERTARGSRDRKIVSRSSPRERMEGEGGGGRQVGRGREEEGDK